MTATGPIIEAMEKYAGAEIRAVDGATLAILPKGKTIVDLQPYLDGMRDGPRRIQGDAVLTTVPSFIDYLNRFKTPDTAVFVNANPPTPTLVSVIDFHGQDRPQFGRHRAVYTFPVSDQLKAWSQISGQPMTHDNFASFIQERQYDIANPPLDWMQVDAKTLELVLQLLNIVDDHGSADDQRVDAGYSRDGITARDRHGGATEDRDDVELDDRYIPRSALYKLRSIRFGSAARLIQLARTVELSVNSIASEGYNPKTGERTIVFKEEHETRDKEGRRVTVPDAFLLRAPVWEGETPQLIPVRLSYRRKGGTLMWSLMLLEWARVVRRSAQAEAERVREATKLPLFSGMPA